MALRFVLVAFAIWLLNLLLQPELQIESIAPQWGFSFSPKQASSLGLDWQEAYIFLLEELKPASVRIPVYWDEVEHEKNNFDFSQAAFLISEAKEKNTPVVVNIGYRVFRYPECHAPEWTKGLSKVDFEGGLLSYLTRLSNELSSLGGIEAIQVDNETTNNLDFSCRRISRFLLGKEIETVKRFFPNMPIMVTWGGSLAPISSLAETDADIIAASFFPRQPTTFGFYDPFSLGKFSLRNIGREREAVEKLGKKFWVSELQFEPWGSEEKTASIEQLIQNKLLLENFGGAERVYLWGAEWWVKKLEEGDSNVLSFVKEVLTK